MKAFQRFLLLGFFAAAGTGLAIWVAAKEATLDDATKPLASDSTAHVVALVEKPATKPASEAQPIKPRIRPRPIVVLPSPPIAAEFQPSAAPPATAIAQSENAIAPDAMHYIQQRMSAPAANSNKISSTGTTEQNHQASPSQDSPAPPLPGLSAVPNSGPEIVPAPPAPAKTSTTTSGRNATPSNKAVNPPAIESPRPIVKADPEGDGKLTIHIQNSELREVLDLLSEQGGLNILAGKDVQGKVSATMTGVDINAALDAILKSTGYTTRRQGKFIFVGTPEEFSNMEQAIDRVGTRVYRPNYVTAAELKTLILPLMTEKVGMVSVSSPSESGIAPSDTTAGGDKFAGGDVVLVRDYEAALTQVDQVVAEVDVRPLQVCIEAMILSVKLDDTDQFGVDFALLQNHLKFGWGTPATSLANVNLTQGGLQFGYLDSNVGAFVNALEQIADTSVIAKPRLMVLNKHRAEILIGDKQGYISTTVTETASTQSVDFLQTGVQLRLRPFISRDGLIRMEIHPELSEGQVTVNGNFTLPNETVTEVTSNIMVRDGCTVVIGGLIKDQLANTTSAIPVLGSLPYIGGAFRDTKETTERDELIVLITPRIIYEPGTCQEGAKGQCEYERRQSVYADNMSPLGKRSIARRYVRLAQCAWAKGDRDTALRFSELAVHFDPLSRDAIELRAQIAQGGHGGDHASIPAAASAGPGSPADHPEIADWMLKDLDRQATEPEAIPLHPFDPGQPGLHHDLERPRSFQ